MPLNLPLVAGFSPNAVPRRQSVLARMLRVLALLLTIALAISSTAVAKKKGGGGGGGVFAKILEVDAVSISVSIGSDGNSQQKYMINDATKVTLNGAPANARDLRAGMVAQIEAGSDGKTAATITAKDAPAHPDKHRVG